MFHHSSQINPIFKSGKADAAVLLIHGFTGTPDCLRPLANHLNSLGYTVSAPLLAGHGTTKENLAQTRWPDWYETVHTEYKKLAEKYNQVFVGGLSLGGLLTLKLCEEFPQGITAFAAMATPLFLKAWVQAVLPLVMNTPAKIFYRYQKKAIADVKDPEAAKNYFSTDEMPLNCIESLMKLQGIVKRDLSKIHMPALIIHSRYDSTAPYQSMGYLAEHISSTTTETVTLENSFHLITIDFEKEIVSKKVGDFFGRFVR